MVVTKSKKAQRKIESGLKRKVRAETMGVSVGITAPAVSRVNERSCWASSICTPNNQSFVHHSYTNNCLEEYYSFTSFITPSQLTCRIGSLDRAFSIRNCLKAKSVALYGCRQATTCRCIASERPELFTLLESLQFPIIPIPALYRK